METYFGTVTRIVQSSHNAIDTVLEIIYHMGHDVSDDESSDDEEDELQTVFWYPLLEDNYDGTLKIINHWECTLITILPFLVLPILFHWFWLSWQILLAENCHQSL